MAIRVVGVVAARVGVLRGSVDRLLLTVLWSRRWMDTCMGYEVEYRYRHACRINIVGKPAYRNE